MTLENQISQGIMDAMKAKDSVRLSTLRNVKKYIIEAKTAGTNIEELPDADTLKIIQKLAKQGTESAEIYRTQGRPDLADEEAAQVAVLRQFLPKALSDSELADAVKAVIAETGASSMQDMGRVMGIASKRLAGQADGGRISAKVRELLGLALCAVLAACLAFTACEKPASDRFDSPVKHSGTDGKCTWTLTEKGTLYLDGQGEISREDIPSIDDVRNAKK